MRRVLLYILILLMLMFMLLCIHYTIPIPVRNLLILQPCAIDGGELGGHGGLELRKLCVRVPGSARVKVCALGCECTGRMRKVPDRERARALV